MSLTWKTRVSHDRVHTHYRVPNSITNCSYGHAADGNRYFFFARSPTVLSSFMVFLLVELLSVHCAPVSERARHAKTQRETGNKKPKQANKQTNQTKQTQTKQKTPETPQPSKTLCSEWNRWNGWDEIRTGQVKNGSMWHLSKASYDAPRARMAGELWTRKLSRQMGWIRSATKANQTKQNKPQNQTNESESSETSAGLRQSLTWMHGHYPHHWKAVYWFRMQTWPGWQETSLGHLKKNRRPLPPALPKQI